MVMALRPSMRGHAPLVACEDYFRFADMRERMYDAYRELIAKAVYLRRKLRHWRPQVTIRRLLKIICLFCKRAL